jgi:hypothetical protein
MTALSVPATSVSGIARGIAEAEKRRHHRECAGGEADQQ